MKWVKQMLKWQGFACIMVAMLGPLTTLAQPGPGEVASPVLVAEPFFNELGGLPGIQKMVDQLLTLALADPRIAAPFKEADLPRVNAKLVEQFCELSGGPCRYTGKSMEVIHDGLNINNAQINALVEALQQAMEQQGIPNRIQNKLIAKLAPLQRQIVAKPKP